MAVSDEAFAALTRVAAESPESILDHRCAVVTLLDHEVVTIRANAITLVAALSDVAPTALSPPVPRLTDLSIAEMRSFGGEGDEWIERDERSEANEVTLMR